MDFWVWLTSPNGLPVLVAFVGLAGTLFGVAGTVLTQTFIARQTKDREERRFEWERERWRKEQEAAEASRFEVAKREAYVGFLNSASTVLPLLTMLSGHPLRIFHARKHLEKSLTEPLQSLKLHTAEVLLLAPEITEPTFRFIEQLDHFLESFPMSTLSSDEFAIVSELYQDVRLAMQRSLSIRPFEEWPTGEIRRTQDAAQNTSEVQAQI